MKSGETPGRPEPGFPAALPITSPTPGPISRSPLSPFEVWDVTRNFVEPSRGLEVKTDPIEAESSSPDRAQLG